MIKKYEEKNTQLGGFTLIELSISLVIIGLIVGGILGAQDLIRQAELRSVMKEVSGFKTAFNTFQLKYNGLPGDIRNATSYWTSGTSNGDGDNRLSSAEGLRAWQQLALAGIIPGSYTGTGSMVPGVSVPASDLQPAGYWAITTTSSHYGRMGTLFIFGTSVGTALNGPSVNPQDAKAIDLKMDDGLADGGDVHAHNARNAADSGWVSGCSTSAHNAASGNYMPQNTDVLCRMFFYLD